jgi:hypothetical protein
MAAHSTSPERTVLGVVVGRFGFEKICQVIVLLIGARCAFTGRDMPIGADGLGYLDVARAYLRHDWQTAVNGYWGPLYSWLLAIMMRFFHSGAGDELAMARALNCAIFTVALYTFSRYWRAVADWSRRAGGEETPLPDAIPLVWIGFGYLLFIVNFSWSVPDVSPDVLVGAIVFAIAALLFKLNDGQPHGMGAYAWLGVLLAIGYFAKAIMLYFALFVLAAMAGQGLRSRNLRRPMAAMVVFVALVFPFVAIVSRVVGHFTAGDSGRLNYAWFVNGPETKSWMTSETGGAPIPFYPGPVALASPRVFRIPSMRGVTYAPWYDAARFDQRSQPSLDWRGQLRQLAVNLRFLKDQLLGAEAALLVPLLILVWYTRRTSLRHLAATWFCTLPAVAVIGMYLLVHLVSRFWLGFWLLLWGAVFGSVFIRPGQQLLARRAVLAGILVFAGGVMPGLFHSLVAPRRKSAGRDIVIADAMPNYGVQPGDSVASIGDGQQAYWAHLARVSVVAEIWSIDSGKFWRSSPAAQQAALKSMADSGAKAAVWRRDSDQPCPSPWSSLPENSGCMVSLP